MCGINGFVDFNKKINKQHLINASNTLIHRGPDDGDAVVIESANALTGLGHRRLSILDLSACGHQPMYNDDRSIVLMLNGTIYNFKEIRAKLLTKGHKFISTSDTEVVLKAYQQYGIKCLDQFIGMFSLVIYDSTIQKLFLIRDRAGVKPLYYYYQDGCLLFSSELKALHQYPVFKKNINYTAVSLYFKYGYIKAPHSIFENAHKLLPGHYAELNLQNRSLSFHQYWSVLDHYNKPVLHIDEKEAIQHLDELCTSAFQYRMVSDVPVGVFLSGGYDSSLLAAILQKNNNNKIKTFTIGFKEDKYNEAPNAKAVAAYLGTDHNELYCTAEDAKQIIPTLADLYDEPLGDSSAIPTILVSRFAKKQVTVALSADGGDEIFAGYSRYDQLVRIKKIKSKIPDFARKGSAHLLNIFPSFSAKQNKIAAMLFENDHVITSDFLNSHFIQKELSSLINKQPVTNATLITENMLPKKSGFINALLAADYQTYMTDDILTKVDRATMSVGLEGREPLLDHRIVEWAAQIPESLKYNKGNKKYLIKQLAHQYIPEKIMNRPKMGFGIPVNDWLKGDLKELLYNTLNRENIARHNILNPEYVVNLRDSYLADKSNNSSQLWLIFVFQLWCDRWM